MIQVISFISIYFNKKHFLSLLNKFFTVLIVIGILFITTKNILLTILFVLIVTLLTRVYFGKCLFYYYYHKELHSFTNILILLGILIILYKILKTDFLNKLLF